MAMNEASLFPVEDYEAIEEAVKETVRGRWFLDEFARRNRQADTLAIVATLERLEKTIKSERAVPDIDRIRLDLADMAEAIVRTKQEIAQIKHENESGNRFQQASNELDAIVVQTEGATNDILLNAERIQELAWTLREQGADGGACDGLDTAATEIYTSCSFQDLTGQRTRKVVTVLRYLESRINAMMAIWGLDSLVDSGLPLDLPGDAERPGDTRPDAHLLNGPALLGHGNDQTSIDDIMVDDSALADYAAAEVEAMLARNDAEDSLTGGIDAAARTTPDVASEAVAPDNVGDDLPEAAPDDLPDALPVDLPAVAGIAAASDVAAGAPAETGAAVVLADDLELVDVEPEDDKTANPFAGADVFAAPVVTPPIAAPAVAVPPIAVPAAPSRGPADADGTADVFAAAPAAPKDGPATVRRQRVGNTVQQVVVAAETVEDPAPVLAVVESTDPISAMSTARRLVTFG
jgi:chemotaxis regulatin CheY-phosphate phosphatase CheZ